MRSYLFHGSRFGGLHGFERLRPPVFFTPDEAVAEEYARGQVLATQRQHGEPARELRPTVYSVTITGINPFDVRTDAHRAIYNAVRRALPDEEDWLPSLHSEGVVAPRTQLLMYSYARPLYAALRLSQYTFDSMWVDEGSQGVSLALFDLRKARITKERPA